MWKNFIPPSGAATCLQGELLRQYEKLRGEAMRNGNRNWDADFDKFVDFLKTNLVAADCFTFEEKSMLESSFKLIGEAGKYALEFWNEKFWNEEISDDGSDFYKVAIVDEAFYNQIEKCIIKFYLANPEPIHFEKLDVYR
ncbi:MAG: hypothetical protein LBM60_07100 [Clostridium sp.]|jgi:hypothetical protein|nr:hypothetical protein [Clostridium sp.]